MISGLIRGVFAVWAATVVAEFAIQTLRTYRAVGWRLDMVPLDFGLAVAIATLNVVWVLAAAFVILCFVARAQ